MVDYNYIKELVLSVKDIFLQKPTNDQIQLKDNASLVTDSDIKVQELVTSKLKEQYPEVLIIAEESEVNPKVEKNKSYFIIDPIDGTTNFAHGLNHSSISLAYVHNGEVLYGIVYNPYRDEIFEGFKDKGAYLNGERIFASETKRLKDSLILFGTNVNKRKDENELTDLFRSIRNIYINSHGTRRTGSGSLDICYVACGRAEGFFERKLGAWDIAAGYIIAKEAGAIMLNYDKTPIDVIDHMGVIVTNKYILDELLENL